MDDELKATSEEQQHQEFLANLTAMVASWVLMPCRAKLDRTPLLGTMRSQNRNRGATHRRDLQVCSSGK
ncbi:MAG: hypothetical protein WCE61_12595 [Candidatus Acidiferrum sp.]